MGASPTPRFGQVKQLGISTRAGWWEGARTGSETRLVALGRWILMVVTFPTQCEPQPVAGICSARPIRDSKRWLRFLFGVVQFF